MNTVSAKIMLMNGDLDEKLAYLYACPIEEAALHRERLINAIEKFEELFGVSRSTLREAMKFLRAENVVMIRQGSGTFVSAGTGVGEDPLGLHFTNQEKLIENLFETRMLIEPQITALACQRATPQDIKNLERLAEEMEQYEVNDEATAELDGRFHTAVAECTHNEVLIRVVPIIIESIRRSHTKTQDDLESFRRAKRSHRRICSAIAQGDFVEAKFQAERHVWETLNDIREREKEDKK